MFCQEEIIVTVYPSGFSKKYISKTQLWKRAHQANVFAQRGSLVMGTMSDSYNRVCNRF